jgi:uncharacterized protein with FMN-binding domain
MKIGRKTATLAVSAAALLGGAGAASAGFLWGWGSAPAQSSAPAGASLAYHNGSFTGPAVRQYYGYVQAKVSIQNGKIASIKILRYPTDYYTSVYINTQALPMLESEVIHAQSTRISGVSGATLTSEAFVRSIQGALRRANG